MFADKYLICIDCEALFLFDQVLAYKRDKSGERMRELVKALAGVSNDERPLKDFLAPGMELKDVWPLWPDGREGTKKPEPQEV